MTKSTKKKTIEDFIIYYFQTQKFQYLKKEIPLHKDLVSWGILYEVESNKEVLEIEKNSFELQKIVLNIAENKLKKKLPLDISEAFRFVDEFDDFIKKEYKAKAFNAYNHIIRGLKSYILFILSQQGLNVKDFLLSLRQEDKRANHLFSFEDSFFNFLPLSSYSENEIFEIINKLWEDDTKRHDVITGLRKLPKRSIEKGNQLLLYAYENDVPLHFVAELLIGLYNAGETSSIEQIIELKDKSVVTCFGVLGRINYENKKDVEKAYDQIGQLEFESQEIAIQQSYLIRNIIENKNTTHDIRENAFKFYVDFLHKGTKEIKEIVFRDIYLIKENESRKYDLLHLYLTKTGNFGIINSFFYHFNDPGYIFDIMMRLFDITPNYRFSMDLFENGIRHAWNINQQETENNILALFKQHPPFGTLAIKVIFTAYRGIFSVDLLKLDKAKYQINAINCACKSPTFFDRLIPLILPLRNSKYKGVRRHLQEQLAKKVFVSYHGAIFNDIQDNLTNSKKDKEFLEPIKEALEDYHKLKELKESINDLNPYDNERDLMDLYYRLEHEEQAKLMDKAKHGKGSFMETAKNVIIVRGNSFMIREGEVSPLGRFEGSMLIDGSSYLNPDLYEHNLNFTE